jgi:hypothetical protein
LGAKIRLCPQDPHSVLALHALEYAIDVRLDPVDIRPAIFKFWIAMEKLASSKAARDIDPASGDP